MKKRLLFALYTISILFLILPIIALATLYIIPPHQDVIDYNYIVEESAINLNTKVGWYKSSEGVNYQITWGAKTGLNLNYFDSLRKNLKSIPLNPIKENLFDTDGNLETAEAVFTWEAADSTWLLVVNTSKTNLKAVKQNDLYYSQKEVNYFNGDVKLAGLLLSPYQNTKPTAVVFIHGSGVSDRDVFWYMYQANYLAQKGITVLLPDKRGCGKSLGEWHTASFSDFAGDAKAALQFLKDTLPSENYKMGVLGLSQGGWISHLVASQSDNIDFVIDVVSSATTPKEQLKHEIKNDIKKRRVPGFLAKLLANIFAKRAMKKRKIWWEKNGNYDPIPLIKESKIPLLKIMAANDEKENVPTQLSIERIDKLLQVNPELPLTLKVFENSGHALFDKETKWIREDYLELLIEWINRQLRDNK